MDLKSINFDNEGFYLLFLINDTFIKYPMMKNIRIIIYI